MKTGWLSKFDQHRRALARLLAAMLLLPVLLGVLPAPALSAEDSLTRDLAISLCAPGGQDKSGQAPLHGHGQDCLLCQAGCSMAPAADVPEGVSDAAWRGNAGHRPVPRLAMDERRQALWRTSIIPRGPPAL